MSRASLNADFNSSYTWFGEAGLLDGRNTVHERSSAEPIAFTCEDGMRNVSDAPPAAAKVSRPPVVEESAAAEIPPEDQRFFDDVLHVGLRHTRALLEKRRKKG
jgi:hypothetical protein